MKDWLLNNLWIKIISLILAVITWFYVNREMTREKLVSREFFRLSHEQGPPMEKE